MSPLTSVPPVAVVLSLTGLAVWAEGLYFLGLGAKPKTSLGHGKYGQAPATAKGRESRTVARGHGMPPEANPLASAELMADGSSAAAAASMPYPDSAAAAPRRLSDPVRAVGMIMFIAGLSDLVQMTYIMVSKPLETPETTILASMVAIPAGWFTYLGISQLLDLDMRPVGNVAIAVGLVPLLWWNFFAGSVMIQADLAIWGLAFLACAAHSYGLLPNKVLGAYLVFVACSAFFLQPAMWALGHPLP
ncbi:MAG TPA: hypothetical protein VFL97_02355 [Nitrococcus sp.]|nr:hypothetical protein [Nitrococcus sp.]